MAGFNWPSLVFLAVVLILLLAAAATAGAEQPPPSPHCGDSLEMRARLSQKYGETPVAFGLQANGNLLQFYASAKTGTWTAVTTSPAGLACIVAAGKNWQALPPAAKDPVA